MRLRTPLTVYRTALFTSLGLTPLVACGGSTIGGHRQSDDAGSPGGMEAGGATNGGSAETGGVIGTGGAAPPACKNPQPRLVNGQPTGLVDCEGGASHRVEKVDCPTLLPRTVECKTSYTPPGIDAAVTRGCTVDSDCADKPNGMCADVFLGPGTCFCTYGCIRDEDCGAGKICLCDDPVGKCVAATDCATDRDCASGTSCMSYEVSPGCPGTAIACQTPMDNCVNNSDCTPPQRCWLQNAVRACAPIDCRVGRPFLVVGEVRVAGVAARDDWTAAVSPGFEGLDDAARLILARRWTEAALMEHASVAAFARFMLDLMSLGAPPELLVSTQAAMADETRHARQAFALASAYSGKPIGPGRLDMGKALSGRSPLEVVRTTILEGCIGETVAAVEAAEALAHAVDPTVRAILSGVAEDEQRHAALAWRFVQWFLAAATPELRDEAQRELETIVGSELTAVPNADRPAPDPDPHVAAHGILDEATRREVRRRVLSDIVAPCARALVATARIGERGQEHPSDAASPESRQRRSIASWMESTPNRPHGAASAGTE